MQQFKWAFQRIKHDLVLFHPDVLGFHSYTLLLGTPRGILNTYNKQYQETDTKAKLLMSSTIYFNCISPVSYFISTFFQKWVTVQIEQGREESPREKSAAHTSAVAQFKFIPFVLATQNLNTVLFSIRMYMNQGNMRNPTVSKVLQCGKNELKSIKMHKALVFLHYCLERYDCFSIYKIESGQFKFLKICMQNTAISYVGGHSHQLLLQTIEHTMLHGRKQQLSCSFREKNVKQVYRLKIHYLEERNE